MYDHSLHPLQERLEERATLYDVCISYLSLHLFLCCFEKYTLKIMTICPCTFVFLVRKFVGHKRYIGIQMEKSMQDKYVFFFYSYVLLLLLTCKISTLMPLKLSCFISIVKN